MTTLIICIPRAFFLRLLLLIIEQLAITMSTNTTTGATTMGTPEIPAEALREFNQICETQEKVQFGIPQMFSNLDLGTHRALRERSLMAGTVRDRAGALRAQLESLDQTGGFYEMRKKLWELEVATNTLQCMYNHYASLFNVWLAELHKCTTAQTAHVNSLLSDSVLDSLRTPTDNAYRNDPDILAYVPDLFHHFVGQGSLHTDAVEPRRAPLPPTLDSSGPVSQGGVPMVITRRQRTTAERQQRPRTPTIDPALLSLL